MPPAKFELVIKIAKAFGLEICAFVKMSVCNFDHDTKNRRCLPDEPAYGNNNIDVSEAIKWQSI